MHLKPERIVTSKLYIINVILKFEIFKLKRIQIVHQFLTSLRKSFIFLS